MNGCDGILNLCKNPSICMQTVEKLAAVNVNPTCRDDGGMSGVHVTFVESQQPFASSNHMTCECMAVCCVCNACG